MERVAYKLHALSMTWPVYDYEARGLVTQLLAGLDLG